MTLIFSSPEFNDIAGSISRIPPIPLVNGQYYWRVRAINVHDTPGEWSIVWSITIPSP